YLHDPRPAYRSPMWILTRWDDCKFVQTQPELFTSRMGNQLDNELMNPERLPNDPRFGATAFGSDDPPASARLRQLFTAALTNRSLTRLEEPLREFVRGLIEHIEPESVANLVEDFAKPIPLFVMRRLLGIDVGMDEVLHRWTMAIVKGADLSYSDHSNTQYTAMTEMFDFFEAELDDRRRRPREDMISAIVQTEVHGDKLTPAEQLMCCWFLLAAGNHTVQSMIALGVVALLERPEQMARLRADQTLVPSAVEEMLRWTTPGLYQRRTAVRDFDMRGSRLRAGDTLYLSTPARNRDPEIFSNPDVFDITRHPNPHMSFSWGPHLCLGAHLSRLEGRIALEGLLRVPRLELAGKVQRFRSMYVNAAEEVPVLFSNRAHAHG
ncbi:MAG: cytochrome P450, partial [Steroidobacteraceae bacterium]